MTPSAPARPAPQPAARGLETPLGASGLPGASVLRRVGDRLGLRTVRDLIFHLPRRYEDLRELRTVDELQRLDDGTVATARVEIIRIEVEQTFRRRVQRTTAHLRDATGEIEATWFGRRFIERRLREGQTVVVSGRIRHRGFAVTFDNPDFQTDDGSTMLHAGRIVPVYRLTAGLTSRTLRQAIRAALDSYGPYVEYLAREALPERSLDVGEAVEQAHYPATFEARDAALRRLAFDELLALQIGMVSRRRQRSIASTGPIPAEDGRDLAIRSGISEALALRVGRPVELTDDQVRAMGDVRTDMRATQPMLRLLQGDVGSGKTAVAAYGLAVAASAGVQAALLAPTDLLVRQHAVTLGSLLDPVGVPVTLLTGSLSSAGTRAALEAIANGQAQVVVGTHALISERVSFARLGMVVIDEQHRFGVEQRGQLEAKAGGRPPHVLLMTATPIPRTLGQVLYADLDVSDLRTPPADRVPVRTGIKSTDSLEGTWQRVRDEAAAGHRTFVVVPLIEDSEEDDASTAERTATELQARLAPLRVGLVHGRLRAADRDEEMTRFRDGGLDVLVGTTVVEVGVDVPEATMMIVLDADRFGLAQLHQLRGRVGRGLAESFCVLVSSAPEGTVARARLEAVQKTRDGFALAEADFELRREGDVLGLVQSGLPALRVASLQRHDHRALAARARAAAEALVGPEGSLDDSHVRLRAELEQGWLARISSGDPASGA